jgi:PiT family inorganic phosphate transporter
MLAKAMPIAGSHFAIITGAIIGVGSVRRLSAVRWGIAGRIVWARILTIPMSAYIDAATFHFLAAIGLP